MAKKKVSNKKYQNSSSLREENNELKHELKKIKKDKVENTHNILMGLYIVIALILIWNTESGYVFAGSIVLGVVLYSYLDHLKGENKE